MILSRRPDEKRLYFFRLPSGNVIYGCDFPLMIRVRAALGSFARIGNLNLADFSLLTGSRA